MIRIEEDRYHGTYSGSEWLCFPAYHPDCNADAGDPLCSDFWGWEMRDRDGALHVSPPHPLSLAIGRGSTPNEALANMRERQAAMHRCAGHRYRRIRKGERQVVCALCGSTGLEWPPSEDEEAALS